MRADAIQRIDKRIAVVRDDLMPGGSKTRFLPALMRRHDHVVYAAPFCGGSPVALAVIGQRLGVRVTLFYAQRETPTPRQRLVRQAGDSSAETIECNARRLAIVKAIGCHRAARIEKHRASRKREIGAER